LGVAAVLMLTCSQPPAPETVVAEPTTVENAELRLRLVEIPADFLVAVNEERDLVLDHSDPAIGGQIDVLVSAPEEGQNLPQAVKFHEAFVRNQEQGDYQGGQELVSPLGTAFYSRGRFVLDGESIEETVVFTLHPDADRMMRLRYRYPAGLDSSIRVQQLFDVLATVEALEAAVNST
jgi:hypothetical protein